jgi:hypothetical protein
MRRHYALAFDARDHTERRADAHPKSLRIAERLERLTFGADVPSPREASANPARARAVRSDP